MEKMEAVRLRAWRGLARLGYHINSLAAFAIAPLEGRKRLHRKRQAAEASELANETARAISWYEEVLKRKPKDLDVKLALGRCHLRLLSFQQADAYITSVLDRKIEHAEANLYAGILRFYARDLDTARTHLGRVVLGRRTEGKKVSMAKEYLGEIALQQGEFAEAIEQLEASVALCPSDVKSERRWILLAEAFHAMGEGEKAIHSLRTALAYNAESERAWNDLGVLLWSYGKTKEARICLETAVRINPDYEDAKSNLAATNRTVSRSTEKHRENAAGTHSMSGH